MVWTGGGGREGFGGSIHFGMPMSEGAGRLVSTMVLDFFAVVDVHEDVGNVLRGYSVTESQWESHCHRTRETAACICHL
jgi:hypothetical protein